MSDPSSAPAARSTLEVAAETPARPRARADDGEEARLCERVASGDDAAFEVLVNRYQHRLFGFCLRMLGDRSEAEDVAQDVFLTVYRNAGEFRGDSAFSTWLFRIAKNQTLNRIKYLERRGRSSRKSLDELGEDRLQDAAERGPDHAVAQDQTARAVRDAISALQEDHRAVVVLRDMEDLSYEEISDITGLPLGTVKSRIHRARSALAKRLARILS